MHQPSPQDTSEIMTALRTRGSVLWRADDIPSDFVAWRRTVRQAARTADLRISVRRVNDIVFIEHVDHAVTDDEMRATMEVVGSDLLGTDQPVTYDEALRKVRRTRMRVVRDDGTIS